MIRYTLSLLALILLAVIMQQFLPSLTIFHHSRVLLVPLVFLCSAVTLPTPLMLLLAFVCGFITDVENTLGPHGGDPEVYPIAVESLRFGHSILLYGVMGFIMQGIQPLFRQGRWQLSVIISGISIFIYLTSQFLLINFVRGDFSFSHGTFLMIVFTSGLTTLFSPLVFWLLFRIADWTSYTIRLDGLKRDPARPRMA